MNRRGFTLIEVLIAMSILATSMLGIYSLLGQSIKMTGYSKSKLLVIDKGYERVMKRLLYPRISLDNIESDNGTDIEYEEETTNTLLPGVASVKLTAKTKEAVVRYEYFERQ